MTKSSLRQLVKEEHQLQSAFCAVRVKIDVLLDETGEDYESAGDEEGAGSVKSIPPRTDSARTYKDFENSYFRLKSALSAKRPRTQLGVVERQPAVVGVQPSRLKYPELKLPSFSGKLQNWINFRDNFRSLIHDNAELSPIDKFNYLRASLRDDALLQINQVQVSAASYPSAWGILEAKYENHKLIAHEHLKALFSVPSMKSESFEALNVVLTTFKVNLQQLEKLGENTNNWSTILAFMLSQKLDTATLRQWETHHGSKDIPRYDALLDFLDKHCAILQSTSTRSGFEQKRPFKSSAVHTLVSSATSSCQICNGGQHSVEQCRRFSKMRVVDRKLAIRRLGLCLNCLSSGHFVADCSRRTCSKCGQRHHYLLHPYSPPTSTPQNPTPNTPNRPQAANANTNAQTQSRPQSQGHQSQLNSQGQSRMNNTQTNPQTPPVQNTSPPHTRQSPPTNTPTTSHHTATSHNTRSQRTTTLLSTALVKLADRFGNTVIARALLDNSSQICMITENLSQRLNFKRFHENLPVNGVGGVSSVSKQSVLARILSRCSSFETEEVKFYVLPRITLNLPQQSFDISTWKLPSDICFADPGFHESSAVDAILGVSVFYDLLMGEQKRLSESGPILCNTKLGWIVAGEIPETPVTTLSAVTASVSTEEIHEQLSRFWELESCRTKSCLSIEESTCESIFEQTTTRGPDGKFRVVLPKKEYALKQLGESKAIATKRFMGLERRLNANPEMKALYTEFIHEYLLMGHMRKVRDDEEEPKHSYYLPHHAVLKPDSTTTKLRSDLLSILIRFRLQQYAIVADVEKMYRMINVVEEDQPLQRILWRESVDEPLRTYQLTTVTYGTSAAPYLATRSLKRCAEEGEQTNPPAAKVIKKDFYVDDMLTGAKSVKEGIRLCKDVLPTNICAPAILKSIPSHLRDERELLDIDATATVNTLGLTWEPATDLYWFKTPRWSPKLPVTQRIVLSDSARLFDPYGLVGPVIVQAKIFLQELWKRKYSWDEPLSADLQSQWLEFRTNLDRIDAVSVPRWIAFSDNVISCELHGFCDASEKAYGAAIYLRCVAQDGKVTVRLVMAKSKVAPLEDLSKKKKRQSIPRLELSSALLLAHLYETVAESIQIPAKTFFWTDSTIVKCWLSSHPSRWQAFVSNRVSEIQHITREGVWNHVPGVENPADVISRGVTPLQLAECSIWWNGPTWLQEDPSAWPKMSSSPEQQYDSVTLEEKPLVTAALQMLPPSEIFIRYSSLLKLVRSTAWILRFANNCRTRNRACRRSEVLNAKEHEEALIALVKLAQSECFPVELADLAAKEQVKPSSRLHTKDPCLRDGLIRVGGRLRHAPVSFSRKHPIVLDSNHPLTKLIIVDYHHRLLHGGAQLMLSCMKERFWPLSGRNLARKVVHECVTCFRARPRAHEQLMGDLPMERVTPAPVFLRVGVDYCGPFNVRQASRKAAPIKCYLCVFVCLVVKAVHIEMVADLTTEAFMAALRRFVSRRGKPEVIFCDSATNFVGARREISELHRLFRAEQFQNAVVTEAASNSIEFKFIPAKSPNFGGLWEAAVKSLKGHMRSVIGNTVLRPDELLTVVTQIEACLNSRPITPISNDHRDLEALTPGHFLVQRPLTAIPEPSLEDIPDNRLSRWCLVQRYSQILWKRWSTDYLSDLHNRNKWTRRRDNLHIGTMVLLKEDKLPPLQWQLVRITEIHPGADGIIRVVTVRTQQGTFRRGIQKICILPIQDNQQQVEEAQ
ncbi:uncharacterized protein LOC134288796 [Aedes albopictus]|uniref:Integrase catalytic domain-containing protein n=1 Tax=Aedes albopictus TaxID=7160 RepID=A0ABM1ZC97_AEDAL